ncbi:MAG: PEP-CTERM sorting domain-containing protein [Pirellulaceae bacterium]|nr:PEP-CTERM sorting domain-containing protein [Pirellulaceae bacterium]
MSKALFRKMFVVCVAVVFGFVAGSANAELLYDFDGLNTGDLDGQDGWVRTGATGLAIAEIATGATGWSGNYLTSTGNVNSARATDLSSVIVDNVGFDFSAKVNVIASSPSVLNHNMAGIQDYDFDTSALGSYLRVGTRSDPDTSGNYQIEWWGSSDLGTGGNTVRIYEDLGMGSGEELVFIVGWEVLALGSDQYQFTPYYENLTEGGDKTYKDSDAFTKTISGISGKWNALYARGADQSGRYLDDLRVGEIGEIPEPSTLALLATGLIGLLAYAWRRRK